MRERLLFKMRYEKSERIQEGNLRRPQENCLHEGNLNIGTADLSLDYFLHKS